MPLGFEKDEKRCPICDGVIWKGEKVIIEGAKMTVCSSCAQYGKKVRPQSKSKFNKFKQQAARKVKKTKSYRPRFESEQLEIVSDYSKRIRKARVSRKLTQEKFAQKLHEKESLIRRLEASKAKPTIELAKKIEEVYNIKLLEEPQQTATDYKKFLKKSSGSSLGDMAFIKKKK